MKNKIGWCDMTWNPVWGCRNHCEYCYARKIAKRFALKMVDKESYHLDYTSLYKFEPTFLESQFDKKLPKKPQRIFVGSMSEIYYWEKEWVEMVIEKIRQYPQHTFQFLTKFPQVYADWVFPPNCWLGITVTGDNSFNNTWGQYLLNKGQRGYRNIRFISFEPLLKEINLNPLEIDWVIIGAETGNRKGKVIPKKQWVWDIMQSCDRHKIPVYIKDNLSKYYPQFGGYKQFPV